jgi:hypothetical protein
MENIFLELHPLHVTAKFSAFSFLTERLPYLFFLVISFSFRNAERDIPVEGENYVYH